MPRSGQLLKKTSQCGFRPQDMPKGSGRLALKTGSISATSRSLEVEKDLKCLSGTAKAVRGAPRGLTEMASISVFAQLRNRHRLGQVRASQCFTSQ